MMPIIVVVILFAENGIGNACDFSDFCSNIGKNTEEWIQLYLKMN